MNTVTITTIVVACTSLREGVMTFFISARTSLRKSPKRWGTFFKRSRPFVGAATISAVLAIAMPQTSDSTATTYQTKLAGELGFEPRSSVLETDSLTVELT